jgi:hypothetical protein
MLRTYALRRASRHGHLTHVMSTQRFPTIKAAPQYQAANPINEGIHVFLQKAHGNQHTVSSNSRTGKRKLASQSPTKRNTTIGAVDRSSNIRALLNSLVDLIGTIKLCVLQERLVIPPP